MFTNEIHKPTAEAEPAETVIPNVQGLSYRARNIGKLGLQTLELRRLIMDLVMCYKIVFGLTCLEMSDFFAFSPVELLEDIHINCLFPVQLLTLGSIFSVFVLLNLGTAW